MVEQQIIGWHDISLFLGMSVSWCSAHRDELFEAGVVKHKLLGRNPNRHWVVYTWPSLLMIWDAEFREREWERRKALKKAKGLKVCEAYATPRQRR